MLSFRDVIHLVFDDDFNTVALSRIEPEELFSGPINFSRISATNVYGIFGFSIEITYTA